MSFNKWIPNMTSAAKAGALAAVALSSARPRGPSNYGAKYSSPKMIYGRRRVYKRKQTFNARVKRVINRSEETKLFSNNASTALLHASIYSYNLTAQIIQGTADGQRLGDVVDLSWLRGNFLCTAPATSGAYSFRVLLLYSGEEANPGTWSTAGLSFAEIFLPNALINTGVTSITNPKAVTVVYDQVFDINSLVASTSDIVTLPVACSIKKHFKYQQQGSVYGKTQNLFLVCIPYVAGGTAGTTSCGSISFNYCLHYKDA